MTPLNLIRSLKENLERESCLDEKPTAISIEHSDELAKATIGRFIDGKWQYFEVFARPIGVSEDLKIR